MKHRGFAFLCSLLIVQLQSQVDYPCLFADVVRRISDFDASAISGDATGSFTYQPDSVLMAGDGSLTFTFQGYRSTLVQFQALVRAPCKASMAAYEAGSSWFFKKAARYGAFRAKVETIPSTYAS